MTMKFAFNLPLAKFLPDREVASAELVRMMTQALEDAGFSAALMSEHPAPSADWLRNDPTAHDSLDPLTALSFVAGASRKLQVFTNILVLPYRNPFLSAKAAATLQILSDNRLILGVGTGYQREEFAALGVPFAERGALTDEAIETMRLAWQGGAVVRKGLHFDAPGNEPRPLPAVVPPIWVGGGSDRAVKRAASLGDGWAPYFSVPTSDQTVRRSAVVSAEHFSEKVAMLTLLREQCGRSGPFDVAVAPPFRPGEPTSENAQRFLEQARDLETRGATWIWTSLPVASPEAYCDLVAWFGQEIIAKFPC
jgi:probable F420-dependent oxidoreductase